ncbi:TraR/DksA C4-type zinc finger protein [Candidatus Falkowbacteria bacterium]|nr:TraR/DksA C4-type zinc finger protein [Candidatus Falkowbacteria bacterium]
MAKSALDKIKDQLVGEKERVENEIGKIAKKGKRGLRFVMDSFGSKDEEHVAGVATLDNKISLGTSLEKSLRDIDQALKKVEQGSYGVCELCEQPIEEGRLKVFPAAISCVNCQKEKK